MGMLNVGVASIVEYFFPGRCFIGQWQVVNNKLEQHHSFQNGNVSQVFSI